MPELPKIVISKLTERALPQRTPHPDPDLLTAFVEHTAPDRERTAVLTHLADCAPCREVVSLSQPLATTTTTIYTPKPTRSLFFLRWGALAACAVLAVSVVLVYQRKPADSAFLAKNQIAQPQAATPATPASDSKTKAAEADKAASESHHGTNSKTKQSLSPTTRSPSNHNEGFVGGSARAGDSAPQTPAEIPLRGRNYIDPSPFTPGVARNAPSAMGARVDSAQPQVPAPPMKQSLNAEQKASDEMADSAVVKRAQQAGALHKPGPVSETAKVTAQATETTATPYAPTNKDDFRASSAPIANLDLATAHQAATWQISSDGKLQRSHDGGKSWDTIPLDPKARVRVVTATGFDVWAAGNNAVLLHSHDAGTHFTNVKIRQNHQTLKGDIVTLTFPDAQNGRLETADHQVWTTTDAGKTWQPSAEAK